MSREDLRAAARRIVEATCEAQGIEPRVTDPATLGKVAAALKANSTIPRKPKGGTR